MGKTGTEILKWIYVLVVAVIVFLFFCLVLDLFGYVVGGGWQALLGKWPIFSGTVSSVIYGPPFLVLFLLLSFAAIARIALSNDVPSLLMGLGNEKPEVVNEEEVE